MKLDKISNYSSVWSELTSCKSQEKSSQLKSLMNEGSDIFKSNEFGFISQV